MAAAQRLEPIVINRGGGAVSGSTSVHPSHRS